MSRIISLLSVAALLLGICSAPALALPPDDYLGDSGIYVGVPNQRPAPNVLIVIDTSRSTLSKAAGDRYDTGASYSGRYNNDLIYYTGQDGLFDPRLELGGNSPVRVDGVTCVATYQEENPPGSGQMVTMTVNVREILRDFGTYSGGGSEKAPNLAGGGGQGTPGACATASNGQAYATGHYLNYQETVAPPTEDNLVIQHTHTETRRVRVGSKWVDQVVSVTHNYRLIQNVVGPSLAYMEPGVGSEGSGANRLDWTMYWAVDDTLTPTHEINGTGALVSGFTGQDGWRLGVEGYKTGAAELTLDTVRQAFYDALAPAINGASPSVNFGFVTYNPQNQGAVLGAELRAYGSDPSSLIAALPEMDTCSSRTRPDGTEDWDCPDVIAAGPQRPQSEALYDAGYYLRASYIDTNGAILSKQDININAQVAKPNPCGYNHIIFLTNGLPNQDTNTPDIGDWDGDGYETDSEDYGLGTHWIDDVAYFLKHEATVNGVPNGPNNPGITTHVVLAFQNDDILMRRTATNGGGAFYNVFNTEQLAKALQEIIVNIVSESNTAFVAPVVPASSTNRTISSNRVYLGLFKPQSNAPWRGNLKKYKVSSGNELLDVHGHRATNTAGDFIYSQSYWGTATFAGVEKILSAEDPRLRNVVSPSYNPNLSPGDTGYASPDPDGGDGGIVDAGGIGGTLLARDFSTNPRKIITFLSSSNSAVTTGEPDLMASQNAFSTANTSCGGSNCITPATLGVADDAARDRLIDYLHGYNSLGPVYPTTAKREWILGDILHSKPLVFNYTKYSDNVEGTCYASGSTSLPIPTHTTGQPPPNSSYNTTFIFVGANDGMMHAFRDCDGEEVWAFIPPLLLDDLRYYPQQGHEYFVDAPPSLYIHDYDGDGNIEPDNGDKVVLLFGLRRGGGNAYLTPNDPRGAYYALDVTDPLNPKGMWQRTFSELGETWSQPRLAKVKDGTTDKVVMFVGAGYDNNEDRRWGNTQNFPVSTVSSPVNPITNTDTTVATNDGDPGVSNAGVTSATGGSQLNPKGRGLYAIEIASLSKDANLKYVPSFSQSGNLVWAYVYGESTTTTNASNIATNSNLTFSIPSDLAVLDWDDDGYADRIYVGDTGGQMWRFNLPLTTVAGVRQGVKANWTGDVIFRSNPGSDSTNGHKIFYRPSVARNGSHAMLYFGTGDREHPLNLASHDRMYMLFDRGQGLANPADGMGVKTESNLIDVTDNTLQESSDSTAINNVFNALYADSNYGWYIRLENPGEKMLAPPVIFFGQAFYTTYAPLTSGQSNCEVGNLGTSRLYHLDFRTGEAVYNYVADNTQSAPSGNERALKDGAILMKADRVRVLGEGIPSGIVTLMDASGKVTMMISASNRVGTYAAPDVKLITPVYWMQWNN